MKKLLQIVPAFLFVVLVSFMPSCTSEDEFTDVVKSSELDQTSYNHHPDREPKVAKPGS